MQSSNAQPDLKRLFNPFDYVEIDAQSLLAAPAAIAQIKKDHGRCDDRYDADNLLLMFIRLKDEERTKENFSALIGQISECQIRSNMIFEQFKFCLLVFYVVSSITNLEGNSDEFLDLCKIQLDPFNEFDKRFGRIVPENQEYFGDVMRVIIKYRYMLLENPCREALSAFECMFDTLYCYDRHHINQELDDSIVRDITQLQQSFREEFQQALNCSNPLGREAEFLYELIPGPLRTIDVTNCFLESAAGKKLVEGMSPHRRLCYLISISTVSIEEKLELFERFLEEHSDFICQQDKWKRDGYLGEQNNVFCAISNSLYQQAKARDCHYEDASLHSSCESKMATLLINFISKHFDQLGVSDELRIEKATMMFKFVPPGMQADAFCYLYFTHLQQQPNGDFNDMIEKAKQFGLKDGELLKLYYTFSDQFKKPENVDLDALKELQEKNEVVAGYLASQSKVQERIGYRWYTVAIACIFIIPGIILAFRNISLYLIQRRFSHRPCEYDGHHYTAYMDNDCEHDSSAYSILNRFKQFHTNDALTPPLPYSPRVNESLTATASTGWVYDQHYGELVLDKEEVVI